MIKKIIFTLFTLMAIGTAQALYYDEPIIIVDPYATYSKKGEATTRTLPDLRDNRGFVTVGVDY